MIRSGDEGLFQQYCIALCELVAGCLNANLHSKGGVCVCVCPSICLSVGVCATLVALKKKSSAMTQFKDLLVRSSSNLFVLQDFLHMTKRYLDSKMQKQMMQMLHIICIFTLHCSVDNYIISMSVGGITPHTGRGCSRLA